MKITKMMVVAMLLAKGFALALLGCDTGGTDDGYRNNNDSNN